MTVTISAADLTAALQAVLPFVDDDTLPTLNAVRIEAGDRTFTATATDRSTLAHARKRAVGTLPPMLLPQAVVAGILGFLRDQAGSDLITITAAEGGVAFEGPSETHPATTIDGAIFPEAGLSKAVADAGTRGTSALTGPVGLDPKRLTRIAEVAAAACPEDALRLYFTGPEKQVRVEVSDWLLFLLMPVRPGRFHQGNGHHRVVDIPNVRYGLPADADRVADQVPA